MPLFESLYIDPNRKDKIIILNPVVQDVNLAYLVLRTNQYKDYPAIVIQLPDKKSLEIFNTKINKIQENNINSIFKDIIALTKKIGLKIMWQRKPQVVPDNSNSIVEAAERLPVPTETRFPLGMNPRNKGIWIFTVRNHRKTIRSYLSIEEQWAAAKLIYEKICYKNNLTPFLAIPKITQPAEEMEKEREKLVDRIKKGYEKADILIESIYDNMTLYDWTQSLEEEYQYNGMEKLARFSAMLYKDFVLNTNQNSAGALKYLHEQEAFRRASHDIAELRIDSITSIVFQKHKAKTKENNLYAIIKFSFDKRMLAILLDLSEKETNNKYTNELRKWVKDTFL